MRKALTLAACLLLACAGVSVAQELPTAEEIVRNLVEIILCSPQDEYDAGLFLYTVELGLLFDIETEAILAAIGSGTDADSVLATLSSLPTYDSQWTVSSTVDPLTDETRWVLQNFATEGRSVYGDPPVLVLRWQAGRTDMYISWGDYISDNDRTVTWRIGEDDPVTEQLSISTNNQSTFFSSRRVLTPRGVHSPVLSMIGQMMDAARFVARITPYNASPVTAVFDIRGLRAEVESRPDLAEWLEAAD